MDVIDGLVAVGGEARVGGGGGGGYLWLEADGWMAKKMAGSKEKPGHLKDLHPGRWSTVSFDAKNM